MATLSEAVVSENVRLGPRSQAVMAVIFVLLNVKTALGIAGVGSVGIIGWVLSALSLIALMGLLLGLKTKIAADGVHLGVAPINFLPSHIPLGEIKDISVDKASGGGYSVSKSTADGGTVKYTFSGNPDVVSIVTTSGRRYRFSSKDGQRVADAIDRLRG